MSKMGLRGFASGLFISTSIFAYVHYFHSTKPIVSTPEFNFTEEMNTYLTKNELITVDKVEYDRLVKENSELEKIAQTKIENDQQSEIMYQTYLVISPGMSSSEVANFLEKANIIQDSNEFQQFLQENNVTQSIKIGEYTLSSAMSFTEIVEIIT